MLLNALDIKKEYRIQAMLDIEKLEIRDGGRIGFIGRNRAGKSALLGVLSGRVICDEGVVRGCRPIAEILQTGETGDEPEARLLSRLEPRDSAIKSGSEKTRCAVGVVSSSRAPLLFADEPITNLGMGGVGLLEKVMKGYREAILVISRSGTLLDQVCNQIRELDRITVRVFDSNYPDWTSQKECERGSQEFKYQQYQREKRRLERATDALQRKSQRIAKPSKRMGGSKWTLYRDAATFQQDHVQNNKSSVTSRLEHLDKRDCPDESPQVSMRLPDAGWIWAKGTVAVRHLAMSYRNRIVLDDISLEMEAGKRIFITGNNGAGKFVLIKAPVDRIPETFIVSGTGVAYSFQDLDTLDPEKAVLESVVEDTACPQHICRTVLANFYVAKGDILKPVSVLSRGEKIKTAPARVLVSGYSLVILDEPTNHMDAYTVEGLEHLLESYNGTLLAVSHDCTFVSHTGDVVCQFEKGNIQKGTAQKIGTQHSGKY